MAVFSEHYADQAELDHALLVEAAARGRVPSAIEDQARAVGPCPRPMSPSANR